MISVEKAKLFAEKYYPEAPEKLAQHLGVDVRESEMHGCDGWCLTNGKNAIIRVNSRLSPTRCRFTLAHELGHLILNIPTIVGESFEDMLGSNSAEERRVNELASELLIPTAVMKRSLSELPVVAAALKRLARDSNVSELATAIRVCNRAEEIGLINASVVLFDNDQVRWQWSLTLTMPNDTAIGLLKAARETDSGAYRHKREDGQVVVASTIENPYFGTATLFVQLLPGRLGMKLSRHEKRKKLESEIFANDSRLQPRVAGMMGALKNRIDGMTEEEAEADFWRRYDKTLANTSMNSKKGREYVRLRISEWF